MLYKIAVVMRRVWHTPCLLYSQVIEMMRNTKGFTIVELMIVIAIFGVLAVVGVPAYLMVGEFLMG